MVAADGVGRRAARLEVDVHAHALGGMALQVGLDQLGDPLWILARHEPAGDLGAGMARDDRLLASACVAAGDAVELQRRPDPVALQERVALLARALGDADGVEIGALVEGDLADGLQLLRCDGRRAVIEALDRDRALGVVQAGEQHGQRLDRVRHRAAVAAGMQVLAGARHA